MNRREDFPKFTMVIGKMFAGYGGREVTDLQVAAYWDTLEHLSLAQVIAAIPEAKRLADRGFPPDDESIRRCAEKQPAAPYHARLQLAEFTPSEPWPEPSPEMAERVRGLTETLAQRQWPNAKRGTR